MSVNEKHIRVSIVIPAFNEQNHLERCLQSIARQTVKPFEVVVVDNNSTDATAKVAASFPFVRQVPEPRQGIVFARSTGFDTARGDVIARTDADAEVPADWVERIVAFYSDAKHRNGVWTGRTFFHNTRFPFLLNAIFTFFAFYMNRWLFGHYPLCGSNMAMLRSQWQAVRNDIHYQTDIHEDLDLAVHLHRAGYRVYYDPSSKVKAVLRRVYSDGDQLWGHLLGWPRTIRVHHRPWLVCLPCIAFFYYVLRPILLVTDRLRRLAGSAPLPR